MGGGGKIYTKNGSFLRSGGGGATCYFFSLPSVGCDEGVVNADKEFT